MIQIKLNFTGSHRMFNSKDDKIFVKIQINGFHNHFYFKQTNKKVFSEYPQILVIYIIIEIYTNKHN